MAHLYRDPEWSQRDLEEPISHAREHVPKTLLKEFLPEHLASYHQTLKLREEQGYAITVADLWGLVLESKLHGQVCSLLGSMAWLCREGGRDSERLHWVSAPGQSGKEGSRPAETT